MSQELAVSQESSLMSYPGSASSPIIPIPVHGVQVVASGSSLQQLVSSGQDQTSQVGDQATTITEIQVQHSINNNHAPTVATLPVVPASQHALSSAATTMSLQSSGANNMGSIASPMDKMTGIHLLAANSALLPNIPVPVSVATTQIPAPVSVSTNQLDKLAASVSQVDSGSAEVSITSMTPASPRAQHHHARLQYKAQARDQGKAAKLRFVDKTPGYVEKQMQPELHVGEFPALLGSEPQLLTQLRNQQMKCHHHSELVQSKTEGQESAVATGTADRGSVEHVTTSHIEISPLSPPIHVVALKKRDEHVGEALGATVQPPAPPASHPLIQTVSPNVQEKKIYSDELLWCDDCGTGVKGHCRQHGTLSHVRDRVIPSRAKLTTPHHLGVKTLELRAGGHHVLGVFAKKVVQGRTQFGPYEGELTDTWKHKGDDRIKMKLFLAEGDDKYLDCTNQGVCNWMMFVRPAQNKEDQNLVAYQYRKNIYFATTKAIAPNEELKVWYSYDYGKAMEAPPLRSAVDISNGHEEGFRVKVPEAEDEFEMLGLPPFHVESQPPPPPPPSPPQHRVESTESAQEDPASIEDDGGDPDFVVEEASDDDYDEVAPKVKKKEPGRVGKTKSWVCSVCGATFRTCAQMDMHECILPAEGKEDEEVDDGKVDEGRRTRSKRKGRPFKLNSHGKILNVPGRKGKQPKGPIKPKQIGGQPPMKRPRGRPRKVVGENTVLVKKKVKPPRDLYQCHKCGKAFVTESKMKLHSYAHTGERPFMCSYEGCKKAFTSKFKQTRHELIHQSEKQHCCPYCQKFFARKDHLKNHLRVHDPQKEMHKCPDCEKEYASSFAFRTHLAFHAADRGELMCGVCKEDFPDKDKLLFHLKIHAGARSVKDSSEKKQVCPFCSKLFFTKKDVKRHLVVHTKDRDFLCQYCPQRFGRRDHLVRHLRKTHVNESATLSLDDIDLGETLPSPPRRGRPSKSHQPAPDPVPVAMDTGDGQAMVNDLLQRVAGSMLEHSVAGGQSASMPAGIPVTSPQRTGLPTTKVDTSSGGDMRVSLTHANYLAAMQTSGGLPPGLAAPGNNAGMVEVSQQPNQGMDPAMTAHFVPPNYLPTQLQGRVQQQHMQQQDQQQPQQQQQQQSHHQMEAKPVGNVINASQLTPQMLQLLRQQAAGGSGLVQTVQVQERDNPTQQQMMTVAYPQVAAPVLAGSSDQAQSQVGATISQTVTLSQSQGQGQVTIPLVVSYSDAMRIMLGQFTEDQASGAQPPVGSQPQVQQ